LAKRLLQGLVKKNFGECWLALPIINHWLTVKWSRTNQFQTSMNIIKRTPYFSGFVLCHMLVVCCSMMARHTVESMIHDYHEYISKLSLESELDLLKYCNIDILTSILTQNKLKHTSHHWVPHVTKNRKLAKKVGKLLWFAKVFYCTVVKTGEPSAPSPFFLLPMLKGLEGENSNLLIKF